MSYLEELLPEFRKGAKIRRKCWSEGKYIKLKGLHARDEYGDSYFLEPNEVTSDDWELNQESIDWQYIIDHKCLCWFWDNDFKYAMATYLREKEDEDFLDDRGNYWPNCRPVRRYEVTFYEDREE